MTRPPEVKQLEGEIEEIKARKEKAIKNQDFEGAAAMRDREKQAKERLEQILREWRATREEKRVKVDEEDILHVVSKWTGIPLQRMEQGEMQRLLQVEEEMTKVVIGQREAFPCSARRAASRADLKDPRGRTELLRCWAYGVAKPCWPSACRQLFGRLQGPDPARHDET
jgi:ATP-dependent Clp protease ATP-binding subunit ClpC